MSNLYPRASEHYIVEEPEEQRDARESEEKSLHQSLPIVNEVIKNLDEWIEFYKSVDSIPADVMIDKEQFTITAYGNKKVVDILRSERDRIKDLVEDIGSR